MIPAGRLAVIGQPDDRRTQGFLAAARAAQWQTALVPWRAIASDEPLDAPYRRALDRAEVIRIDSPGNDRQLDAVFRGDDEAGPGELRSSAAWHRGLVASLHRIEPRRGPAGGAADRAQRSPTGRASGPSWVPRPVDVGHLFDKAATARRLAEADIPVPDWHEPPKPPAGYDDVAAAADALGSRRLFLKPRYGSSGAGVVAVDLGDRRAISTSGIDIDADGRLLYSTRPSRRHGAATVDLIDRLCALDEIRVERWYPKAGLDGHVVDLRVVVIAGEPRHAVVRAARQPITNLNLGGRRGDLEAFAAALGPHRDPVLDTCRQVAATLPHCLHLGIDIMVAPGFRHHVVGEVNVFGDLLPGITDRGRSTFEAEVDALADFLAGQVAA